MTLAELKTGDYAEILGYAMGNAHYRAKLLALGLTRGAQIKVVGWLRSVIPSSLPCAATTSRCAGTRLAS